MSLFSTLRKLLPDAAAWRLPKDTTIRKFFEGLSEEPEAVRDAADLVFLDIHPTTTRHLEEWESQFGHVAIDESEEDRRLNIAASWSATGGQDPKYIQDQLQAAGFDVYIHEWWESGPPWVARNPLDHAEQPLIGIFQCEEDPGYEEPPTQWECFDGPGAPYCNDFLANDPRYIVNLDLTGRAPPPIPEDPSRWPFFLYICGETFPEPALIPANRRAEFERRLLKIAPSQQWLVLIMSYTETLLTEDGDGLLTEDGDNIVAE